MLTLAAADTIAADADAATTLTCTIFGMELNAGVEAYKALYQGQLAAAVATIYTVPTSTQAFIRSISVVNTDTAATHQFQFFRGGTGAGNQITPLLTIPAGGYATYEDGLGWQMFNASGQILQSNFATISPTDNWGITGSKGETMDRNTCPEVNTTAAASGTLNMAAVWLTAGTLVSNISFFSATTAAGTPTNYFFGLFDASRNLLATSANQTTAAWAANTIKTLAMTTPYTVPTTGLYYLGYFMTATTVPTLKGGTAKTGAQLNGTAPILYGTSSTGLTTALPNPAAALTATTASLWACVT